MDFHTTMLVIFKPHKGNLINDFNFNEKYPPERSIFGSPISDLTETIHWNISFGFSEKNTRGKGTVNKTRKAN